MYLMFLANSYVGTHGSCENENLKMHPPIFHANPSCGLIVWMVCFLGSPRHTSKLKVFFRKPSWVVATQILGCIFIPKVGEMIQFDVCIFFNIWGHWQFWQFDISLPCEKIKLTTCAAQCLPNQKDIETPSGHRLVHLGRILFCTANIVEVCDGIFFDLLFHLQIHEGFFHFRHSGTDRFMIEWLYSRPLSPRPQGQTVISP